MTGNVIHVEKATIDDAEEILRVQKLAFKIEAKLYNDVMIPPITETIEALKAKFETNTILKAVVYGKIVGSIRAFTKDGSCYIGRLSVHPDFQNRGYATKLTLEVEHIFSSCSRFELFTGEKSIRTIRLYERLGYTVFKVEKPVDDVKLVFLQKLR